MPFNDVPKHFQCVGARPPLGTVRGRDAATEPPWMGLRRVPWGGLAPAYSDALTEAKAEKTSIQPGPATHIYRRRSGLRSSFDSRPRTIHGALAGRCAFPVLTRLMRDVRSLGMQELCFSVMCRNTFGTSVLSATRDRSRQDAATEPPWMGSRRVPWGA